MRQALITYAIKDTANLRAVQGHLLGSGFEYIEQVGQGALWAEVVTVRVREDTDDEQQVTAIVRRHAPTAHLLSRRTAVEPVTGYRAGRA